MAYKMTKRGSLDNETTNEFFCDTDSDLANIPNNLINLGSVAVVIEGMKIYIANSKREWVSFMSSGSSDSSSGGATSPVADQGTADNMILQE